MTSLARLVDGALRAVCDRVWVVPSDRLTEATEQNGRRRVSVRAMLLGTGPRFARDAFGPVVVFYVGWKIVGLSTGIVAATVARSRP